MDKASDQATTERREREFRAQCLERDGYRCAISGAYDLKSIDQKLIKPPSSKTPKLDSCDAAHIIPHAMGSGNSSNRGFEVGSFAVYRIISAPNHT
jgi:hypothetical protein